MNKAMNVSMPHATCRICGQPFISNTYNQLHKQLYHHGIDVHLMELRRAAKQHDGTTDPIWVVDYLKGITNDTGTS